MLDLLPSPCGSSAFASFSGKASSVHSVARLVFFLLHGFRSPFLRFLSWLVTFVTWMSFLLFFLLSLFGFQGAPAASFAAMGLSGLEPPTSRLSGVRSNRLSYKPKGCSHPDGDGEIRTLDPLLARQVLSQLSYAPIFDLAATCSPIPSPVQYHRPLKS